MNGTNLRADCTKGTGMIDKIWRICIPIVKEPGIRQYFGIDFCMEVLITLQPALALPVF